jgi:hypothetical protein
MDENEDSRVGFQEIPKYCMKGGMMRGRNYFGLLVMLLFAFVTLFAPTRAKGSETITGTGVDDFLNQWTVISTATEGGCEDNKENPLPGTLYSYDVSVKDSSGNDLVPIPNVIQFSVDHDICPNDWDLTYPTRSTKDLLCDPNTKFRCDDPQKGVIAVSSLKADPDNHYRVSYCVEGGTPKIATGQLQTETGNVLIYPSLSPGCCTESHNLSSRIINTPNDPPEPFIFGGNFTGNIEIHYNQCSGNVTGVEDAVTNESYGDPICGPFYVGKGSEDSYIRNSMNLVTKAGPEDGAVFIAGNIYVSYGTCYWKGPTVTTTDSYQRVPFAQCTDPAPDSFQAYDGVIYTWYDGTTLCDVTLEDEHDLPLAITDYNSDLSIVDTTNVGWVCEPNISRDTCSVVYHTPQLFNLFSGSWGCFLPWGWPCI